MGGRWGGGDGRRLEGGWDGARDERGEREEERRAAGIANKVHVFKVKAFPLPSSLMAAESSADKTHGESKSPFDNGAAAGNPL